MPDQTSPGRVGVDPQTGRLTLDGEVLDRWDRRLYGNSATQDPRNEDIFHGGLNGSDPRYYSVTGSRPNGGDDGGSTDTYALRPEYAQRVGNRVQLGQSGVGGWAEVIDPSKVTYDEEFGFLTDPSNMKPTDPGEDRRAAVWYAAIMAPAAYGVAANIAGAAASGASAGDAVPFEANYPGNAPWTPPSEVPPVGTPAPAPSPGTPPPTGATPPAPTGAPGTPTAPTPSPVPSPEPVPFEPNYPGNAPWQPPASGTPIIQGANPNLISRAGDWYNGLSPLSRTILGLGVSQAASAALQANAQRNAQQFQQEQIDRVAADRVRRGQIPSFGNAFTPKPGPKSTGIIDSRRRG